MITSRETLQEYLRRDNPWLRPGSRKEALIQWLTADPARTLRRYLRCLRLQEYYINTAGSDPRKKFLALYYEGRKNRLGSRLGIEIGPNCFGKGLNLYHGGSIVINPAVRAGEGCSLHGTNCIGNNGLTQEVPTLGSHVDIGYGAVIIGGITVADGVTIGANAVVNRSILEPGCTVAGVPARIVKHADQ